jgi:hypothetical protein
MLMLVIVCSVALDGKWMFLFIMLACWLLDVLQAMMVIGCPKGRWFSPCTPVSPTNKTDRHDIAEILLNVSLNTINHKPSHGKYSIL